MPGDKDPFWKRFSKKNKGSSMTEQNGGNKETNVSEDTGKSASKEYADPDDTTKAEKIPILAAQIGVIILATGLVSIATGSMLNKVQTWEAFGIIKDLYLLMPVLQGLKSNVDTCLSARFSTQANLGNLSTKAQIKKQIICNMALVQVQTIVGSVIVSLYSCALGAAVNRDWSTKHALLLATCATITTSGTSLILDMILIGLILGAHRLKINPDNIICPLASTVADLLTMVVFSYLINATFFLHHTEWWVFILIMAVFHFVILPLSIIYSLRDKETKKVLITGWVAVVLALIISSLSSLVLDLVIEHYTGYTLFQPVLNGTTGSMVSILLPRLSTMLYKTSPVGTLHPKLKRCSPPHKVWFHGTPQARCVRLLIAFGVPGQLIFVFLADYIYTDTMSLHAAFVSTYIVISFIDMLTVLYIGHTLTHTMYRYKIDPDNVAIPYVNAISDFIGSSLLASGFAFLMGIDHCYLQKEFGRH